MEKAINITTIKNATGESGALTYRVEKDEWETLSDDEKSAILGNFILTQQGFESGDFTFQY